MNGSIDSTGHLFIERAGINMEQLCFEQRKYTCGDWCPQFGEPEREDELFGEGRQHFLNICQQKTLWFEEFTDNRHDISKS